MPKIGDIKTETTPDGKQTWTSVYTSSGWKASKAMPVKGKGGKSNGNGKDVQAARAVTRAVGNLTNRVGSAVSSLRLGNNGSSSSQSSPSPSSSSSGGGSGASSTPAAPPKKPAGPPKPGAVYRKTRAAYKSEQANQPRQYETPEQNKARMDKSQFDMSMSGDDVKKYRKAYLAKHPAAAKAVAKGTLSMGDINMTVRRLKKKGNMNAFGMKSEDSAS